MTFSLYRFFWVIFCYLLLISESGYSQHEDSAISKKIESYYTKAYLTGSHLAYTITSLLSHKHPEHAKRVRDNLYQVQYKLSQITLGGTAQGGMTWQSPYEFSAEIDILTGKRAVDESLQLDSIDQDIPPWRPTPAVGASKEQVDLDSIEHLKIKTHPWNEMLEKLEKPEISPIYNFAPRDNFLIHFNSFDKFNELENAFKELTISLGQVFSLEQTVDLKNKIKERLGLKKLEIFEPLVKEVLFISEDLDFYPNTHYAVILSFKSDLIGAISEYATPGRTHVEMIDSYLVIATSEELLAKIKNTKLQPERSLGNAGELAYALAVLDKRRDGFIYLSEDFILKLVSPQYRITAARRNVALKRLEALQYAVFAYKVITEKWPSKLSDMVKEKYIEAAAIEGDYELDSSGIVRNKTWGTLYDVRPISEVKYEKVSKAEKERYDSFREGYQSFWREFFDPVGVAISVGDQIYFQTIILPLIDNSEYRTLMHLLGKDSKELKSLNLIRRIPTFSLITTLQIDQLLLDNAHEFVEYAERELTEKASDDEKKKILNDRFTKLLGLNETFNIFGIVGEEFVLGVDGNQSFSIQNLADVDVFFGLELKDQARFKDFINKVYQRVYREISRDSQQIFPFFQLSSEEPLQNEYNKVKYYLIPAGFVNLYFVYLDNYVYFSISQLSINRLIDSKGGVDKVTTSQRRAIDYLSNHGNAMFLFDASSAQKMSSNLAELWMGPLNVGRIASQFSGYLTDIDLLSSAIGDTSDIKKYFPFVPTSLLGAKVDLTRQGVRIGDQKSALIKDIKFDPYLYINDVEWIKDYQAKEMVEFSTLHSSDYVKKLIEGINKLKDLGVLFRFTEHGLETRVVVNNPLAKSSDLRFPEIKISGARKSSEGMVAGKIDLRVLLFISTLLFLGFIVFLIKRTKPRS